VTGLLLYINRRSGVAHVDRNCESIVAVPARYLRLELHDSGKPRRHCSRCWGSDACPRSRAFAGTAGPVTESSEGNPRSGLTGTDGAADTATERAGAGASPQPLGEVGSSDTRPSARSVTPWLDDAFEDPVDLRFVRLRGYVINIRTGEVLSSVIADVCREQRR
jgi:hypothetical protein